MLRITPRRWTSQPQFATGIDWSNPITAGLAFNASAINNLQDTFSNVTPASTGTVSRVATTSGLATSFSSAQESYGNLNPLTGNKATFNIVCVPSSLAQVAGLVNKRDSSLLQHAYSMGFNYAGTQEFSVNIGDSSGANGGANYSFNTTESFWVTGGLCNITVIIDGSASAGNKVKVWCNGRQASYKNSTLDNSFSSFFAGTSPLLLGRVNTSGTNYFSGSILSVSVINRALSPAEAASLSANPWQIFSPALC